MKTVVIALFAFLFLMPTHSFAQSQFASASITLNYRSQILLAFDDGEGEVIPLRNPKVFANSETREEIWMENQVIINKMLGDMTAQGYEVLSVKMSNREHATFMYYLFEKRRDTRRDQHREPLR